MNLDNQNPGTTAEPVAPAIQNPTPPAAPAGEPVTTGSEQEPDYSSILRDTAQPGAQPNNPPVAAAQPPTNPFVSPLHEEINNLFKQGKTVNDIQSYLSIQGMNLDSMSALDKVKNHLLRSIPGLTEAQLPSALKKAGIDVENLEDADTQLNLLMEGNKAHQYLADLQKKHEVTPQVDKALVAEQAAQALSKAWEAPLDRVLPTQGVDKIRFKTDEGEYSLDYQYSADAVKSARQLTLQLLGKESAQLTPDNLKSSVETFHTFARAYDHSRILEAVVKDMAASFKAQAVRSVEGPRPSLPPMPARPVSGAAAPAAPGQLERPPVMQQRK